MTLLISDILCALDVCCMIKKNTITQTSQLTFQAFVDPFSLEVGEPRLLHHHWAAEQKTTQISSTSHYMRLQTEVHTLNRCVISHLSRSWVSLLYWAALWVVHRPPPTLPCWGEASICKRLQEIILIRSVAVKALVLFLKLWTNFTDSLWWWWYFFFHRMIQFHLGHQTNI